MAAEITSCTAFHFPPKSNILKNPSLQFSPPWKIFPRKQYNNTLIISSVFNGRRKQGTITQINMKYTGKQVSSSSERYAYITAAVMSSVGIGFMAVSAVYCRFLRHNEGGEIPLSEVLGTFAFSLAAAVGMEYISRWTHRELWHSSLWYIHKSHHRPREGIFEFNDVFAVINSVPAIALLNFGFFHKGLLPGLCFGAGLGMTLLGMAYIFVHNGIVHGRFPVGPIANLPFLLKVAAAHQIHHSLKLKGVPYGLFLGVKELQEVGGMEELNKEINRTTKRWKGHEL